MNDEQIFGLKVENSEIDDLTMNDEQILGLKEDNSEPDEVAINDSTKLKGEDSEPEDMTINDEQILGLELENSVAEDLRINYSPNLKIKLEVEDSEPEDVSINDAWKLGIKLEREDSEPEDGPINEPTNSNEMSKRKATDDSSSFPNKKKKRTLRGMKAHEIRSIIQNPRDTIEFCQDLDLLAKFVKCDHNHDMKLASYPSIKDEFKWKCNKNGHTARMSIRKGTWFENSRLTPADILWMAYMWVFEYSQCSMLHECDHSNSTVGEWCSAFLDLCKEILEYKCSPLGGNQKTVEIFECKLTKAKCKQKELSADKWVFCAIEQNSTKSLLIVVEDKTSDTLLQIFKKYILPGTTVVGQVWTPYKNLTANDFELLTKEMSLTFYDLVTKSELSFFKNFINKTNRHRTELDKKECEARFYERIYRRSLSYAPDAFLAFLKDVSLIYKPCEVYARSSSNVNDD